MEIKRSPDTATESANTTINVASAFKNFPWTALQQSSKGANIISAINQLLSMYHPNDGIVAYEHVIKTLLILSESLDRETQQQIISVVPFPKGVSNDKIRNVIYKTVELVNTANSISTCPKIAAVSDDNFNMDALNENSEICLNQNILLDTSQNFELNEQFIPSVPEVFKGFPPNEISTIHSHLFLSNINEQEKTVKVQSNLKWFHTRYLSCKSNLYQSTTSNYPQGLPKSMDNKYFQLSIDRVHNWNQCNVANLSHAAHQGSMYLNKKLYRSNILAQRQNKSDVLNLEITYSDRSSKPELNYEILNSNDINEGIKSHNNNNNNIKKTKNYNIDIPEHLGTELRDEQQAIQRDIYKMDVVYCDEERNDTITNSQILKEDDFLLENFDIRNKLKTSLQHFLKHAEQDILIEFPMLSETKALQKIPSTSKCWKSLNQENLESNNQLDISSDNMNNYKSINVPENMTKFIEKKSPASSRHMYPKLAQLQVHHKNLKTEIGKARTVECERKDSIENLLYKSAVKQTKQKSMNTLQQTTSITELATFKRQYYDTLLNIQKAKMAVANSLAISSIESCSKYDPYYSNHSYQQQQLLQQQVPLTINSQFAIHTMAQSGLSNMHNTPYTWMRSNNWKHPTMKQLRPQQFPFYVTRNKE